MARDHDRSPVEGNALTSLVRFLLIVAILAGLGYAGLVALVYLVEPQQREIVVTVPANRIGK
ncbi:histidine kinase [Terrarubrum flagellatum]|uniref:histidine kinase n=1 Tax=Terrirubrum flagellatum TaxID=2895980 RepID=UPI003144FE5F